MRRAPILTLCLIALLAGCRASETTAPQGLTNVPSPQASVDPFPPETITAYVVRADAPLMDEPGEKSLVVRYLDSGETLTVLYPDRGGPWYEVQSDLTKQHGWGTRASRSRWRSTSTCCPACRRVRRRRSIRCSGRHAKEAHRRHTARHTDLPRPTGILPSNRKPSTHFGSSRLSLLPLLRVCIRPSFGSGFDSASPARVTARLVSQERRDGRRTARSMPFSARIK